MSDVEIQILIQSFYSLFRTTHRICRVDLIVCVLVAHIQVSVAEYGYQLDLSGLTI